MAALTNVSGTVPTTAVVWARQVANLVRRVEQAESQNVQLKQRVLAESTRTGLLTREYARANRESGQEAGQRLQLQRECDQLHRDLQRERDTSTLLSQECVRLQKECHQLQKECVQERDRRLIVLLLCCFTSFTVFAYGGGLSKVYAFTKRYTYSLL